MKKLILATTCVCLTAAVSGATPMEKCEKYIDNEKAVIAKVESFDLDFSQLEKRRGALHSKISTKRSQNQNANDLVTQAVKERDVLKSRIDRAPSLIKELANKNVSLESEKASIQKELDRLRKKRKDANVLKKAVYNVRISLKKDERRDVENHINANKSEMALLTKQANDKPRYMREARQKVQDAKRNRDAVLGQAPTLSELERRLNNVERRLVNREAAKGELEFELEEAAQEKKMCLGFHRLKVKYPTALKVAKEVAEVGCEGYVSKGFRNKQKRNAEGDVLEAVCK